jgi:hypothetical protein
MATWHFNAQSRRQNSLEQAAAAGVVSAQSDLALALFRSNRREEAMPWVSLAAEAGDPRCQYLLGVALHNGDFLPRDERRAVRLLSAAAKAGIEPARDALLTIKVPAPPAPSPMALLEALLRPMLAERLETLLPRTIERAVAAELATRSAEAVERVG